MRADGISWRKIGAFLFGVGTLTALAAGNWSQAILDAAIFTACAWPWLPTIRRPDETVTKP
jgi:hypothetical protein